MNFKKYQQNVKQTRVCGYMSDNIVMFSPSKSADLRERLSQTQARKLTIIGGIKNFILNLFRKRNASQKNVEANTSPYIHDKNPFIYAPNNCVNHINLGDIINKK